MSPPSSRQPAGVPSESGGNAKYAVVALALAVAAGGLYWWRSSSRETAAPPPPAAPAPSVAASASAAPADTAQLEDIPLPPPANTTPEAGPRIVYVPGGGCEGTCRGAAPPELGAALQVRANVARRCYNQALASDSSLRGHVRLTVRVGPSGNVCSAVVTANDMGTPNVAQCAANVFRSAGSYPAPRGGCVDATVPLSFVPQGG